MGCLGCTTCSTGSGAKGCQSNGGCGSGGCNRLNTFDWLARLDITDVDPLDLVEVSFKNGSRKGFFRLPQHLKIYTGDMAVVETGNGYDVGKVSLSGELVRLQMKKKRVDERSVTSLVLRRANDRDLERLQEAIELEQSTMVRARAIARTLGLEMKIGDVEFQGDKRKATFYYTADGRVDFRELIRHFAREFKVKIEMRQIGARQESARIGGIGSCGRELCCSTWLSDFKSVSTSAARYQNLAINQAKLSGQCGRLKCCLNYELDTYLDALEDFPAASEKLHTEKGSASLIKTDIFKKILYYTYDHERGRGKIYPLTLAQVHDLRAQNAQGVRPADFEVIAAGSFVPEDAIVDYSDVTGAVELPEEKRRRKKKKKGRGGQNQGAGGEARRSGGPRPPAGERSNEPRPERGERRERPAGDGGARRDERKQGGGQERPERRERQDQSGRNNPRQGQNQPRPPQGSDNRRPPEARKPQSDQPNQPNRNAGGAEGGDGAARKKRSNNRNKRRNKNNPNNPNNSAPPSAKE